MQTALHPKIDLRPSIFSKLVDNFIDVFREEPVKCPEDRPERRFLGPREPSNFRRVLNLSENCNVGLDVFRHSRFCLDYFRCIEQYLDKLRLFDFSV